MHFTALPENQYQQLLNAKVADIQQQFADLNCPTPIIVASTTRHFRLRAEFRVWHQDDDLFYAMFDPADPKTPIAIDHFPTASGAIDQLMPVLRDHIKVNELLRNRLFQVEFLSTLSGDMLVTLIYHRRLDSEWQIAAQSLAASLGIQVIGRSRKQKVVLDRDYVEETLTVLGQQYRYRQYEGGFTQPNGEVNQQMIGWAKTQLGPSTKDLLELYCGNGNFTIPLAGNFRNVLATEISKTSVRAALENFDLNSIKNVQIVRMSSEELTQALNGEREFRRLQDCNLSDYDFDAVFVDPPRAGLDEGTRGLVSQFERILYISCNPDTLHRDVQLLTKTHHLKGFALFDQFPYTKHMECGAYMTRRT